ncbi:MAG: efflux RND transporter permease subunit [Thermoguttaceae bacterium]
MTTSQFFVYKRPVAWTALAATLLWGGAAYWAMPQRHDPIIPIRMATIVTIYPGADAEKVEQEVTKRIENQVGQCEKVEKVYSTSRQNLSVVFVELFDSVRDTEQVWQDLQGRLASLTDLPTVRGRPVHPIIDKDFGETVTMMLTISSPKVSDFEIRQRAKNIRTVLEGFRRERPERYRRDRLTAILVYPNTVGRSYVLWLGESLMQRLTEKGLIEDGQIVEAPNTGCLDFQLVKGKTDNDVIQEALRWDRDSIGTGMSHPDIWPGIIVRDLRTLEKRLGRSRIDPLGSADHYSYRELLRFADLIRDRLKQYPTIGKIDEIGRQKEAIYLYYSSRRFSALDLSPALIAAQLERRNINLPGGRVETPEQNVFVHPSGEFTSEQQLGEVVMDVRAGYPTYLRDLVDIVRGYEDPPGVMNFRSVKVDADDPPEAKMPGALTLGVPRDGEAETALPKHSRLQTTRAITLAIRQIKGSHIDAFARDVEAALASLRGILPDDLRIERTHDEPREVREKIVQFDRNLVEAVVIVVLVALLFMEWRSALLVAVSIPLTVAMTLGVCQMLGIDLQQVSIAAMIIALGLLVDDPVVAGDAINREMADGQPRDVAAWLGPQKLARAILYATVTNCVAFLPLLLIKGRVGDFIYSLPVVVVASLVSSRIVSMTFIPLLGYYILRGQRGFEAAGETTGFRAAVAATYRRFSSWCLDHKALTLGVATLLLVLSAAILPMVGTAFFPKDLHNVFSVNVYLAEGTPIRETRNEVLEVLDRLEKLEGKNIRGYTTFVGQGGPRFWLSIVPEQRADNYAQILVHTLDARATRGVVERLKRELPLSVPAARITIEELETGPPIGVPVQIRLFGDDITELRRLAAETKQQLRAIPGTDNIHDDWNAEVFQLVATIDPDRANLSAGITNEDVALLLQTGLSGTAATYLREEDRQIPITFRLRSDERSRIEELSSLDVVSAATNARVPISQIVKFSPQMVSPKICRRDLQRCITVKCDTRQGVLASEVVRQMQSRLDKASRQWPPGYRFKFGGESEEQVKGFSSVALALAASMVLIYLALVLQFNSVTKPFVVFVGVPFGLIGGTMGLVPFGVPFGFMAFLGVASLAGVIVSHVIVLFDYIEEACERGEPLRQAVVESALVRLRPVLVTVLATVGGLIPLAIEGGPLWEPMCYVQIAGLLLATLVTLGIVPVVYVAFVENLHVIRWAPEKRAVPEPRKL